MNGSFESDLSFEGSSFVLGGENFVGNVDDLLIGRDVWTKDDVIKLSNF